MQTLYQIHVSGTAGETKTHSTSSGCGVGCPPEATSAVLAKPLLEFQEASEAMHVEAGVGRNRASVVRVD